MENKVDIPIDKKLNPVVELLKMMGMREITAKVIVYLSGFTVILTSILIGSFKIGFAIHDFTNTIDGVIVESNQQKQWQKTIEDQLTIIESKIEQNTVQAETTKALQHNAIIDLSEVIEYTNIKTLKILKEYTKAIPDKTVIDRSSLEIEVHMNETLPHKKGRIIAVPNPSLKNKEN